MPFVIRASELQRTDRAAVQVARGTAGVSRPFIARGPGQTPVVARPGEVLYPRWIRTGPNTGRTMMLPLPAAQIPAGWQSMTASVPMRLASCEEVDCPLFVRGWTEVLTRDGNSSAREGKVTQDEAAKVVGLYGPRELPPTVIHHEPGTPCGDIHKVPSGLPPVYEVNGRPTLWNEFEDALAGGMHQVGKITKEGRY